MHFETETIQRMAQKMANNIELSQFLNKIQTL